MLKLFMLLLFYGQVPRQDIHRPVNNNCHATVLTNCTTIKKFAHALLINFCFHDFLHLLLCVLKCVNLSDNKPPIGRSVNHVIYTCIMTLFHWFDGASEILYQI